MDTLAIIICIAILFVAGILVRKPRREKEDLSGDAGSMGFFGDSNTDSHGHSHHDAGSFDGGGHGGDGGGCDGGSGH